MYSTNRIPITSWAEEDRPREKLVAKGRHVLTDAELLAIILGTGSRNESAVDLSRRLLSENENSLEKLSRLSVPELIKYDGIGEAKAISITAALELGRRRNAMTANDDELVIRASADGYNIIRPELEDLDHEQFWVILLNRGNKVLRKELISRGGMNATVVDPKLVFRAALSAGASGIVVCHNHPSGGIKASENDIRLTRRLREAAVLLEITLLDHIIVGANSYFSFADDGLL
ncbi:MAG TPA: DNA repair protein RadC [Bacteroidia bacterium]|nr:DNA repair protein RadC [Bacteroidia bacterium]